MSKFFPASTRHAKAWEFLKLRHEAMIVMEYVARFIKLARFADDYVATDIAKVRKFEDGLKLSIRGKIVGFLLQDMDSMVRIAMAIERDIDDANIIRDAGASGKRKEGQLLLTRGRSRGLLFHSGFKGKATTIKAKAKARLLARQGR